MVEPTDFWGYEQFSPQTIISLILNISSQSLNILLDTYNLNHNLLIA